jgi:hypothetical protein
MKRLLPNNFLILAICLNTSASFFYFFQGYSLALFIYWTLSLLSIVFLLYQRERPFPPILKFKKSDLLFIFGLAILFAPLYLFSLHTIPFQINSDEVVVMDLSRQLTEQKTPDLFGLSPHFGFPSLVFIIFGFLSRLLGEVNLNNMRVVHASFGLLIILLNYIFFKAVFNSNKLAITTSIILGANHTFLALSRMALRENSSVLIELLSLLFLLHGFKHRSVFTSFIGGALAGISLYLIFPARMVFILWSVFMLCLFLINLRKKYLLKIYLTALLAFILIGLPVSLATIKDYPNSVSYGRQQLLVFQEGREFQQQWVSARTVEEGLKINFLNGVTTFNSNIHDHGYLYFNPGFGFNDPITGILLWLGVFVTLIRIRHHSNHRVENLFMVSGFLTLLLSFSLFITKSPNYGRLLIILVFIVFLAAQGIIFLSELVKKNKFLSLNILVIILLSIFFLNVQVFSVFVKEGLNGHDIGGTGRYVESRKSLPNYSFLIAADENYPFYSWGGNDGGVYWLRFFASKDQRVEILSPNLLLSDTRQAPFTIFLSQSLWDDLQPTLSTLYPNHILHTIKPGGLALEVH